jgi:hypothetical protein
MFKPIPPNEKPKEEASTPSKSASEKPRYRVTRGKFMSQDDDRSQGYSPAVAQGFNGEWKPI